MKPSKLCLIVSLCAAARLFGDDASALRQRLLTEGVESQRFSRQRLVDGSHVHCRFEVIYGPGENPTVESAEEWDEFFSFPNRVLEITPPSKDGVPSKGKVVDVVNNEYQFRLGRQTPDAPWTVNKVSSAGLLAWLQSGNTFKLEALAEQQLIVHERLPAWTVYFWPVDQFLVSPSITIKDVHRNDKGRVLVTFVGDIPTLELEGSILGGTISLWPERGWAVDEYVVDVSYKTNESGAKYQKAGSVQWTQVGGSAVPVIVSFRNYNNGKLTVERRWSFSDWSIEKFPPERFRLSHYGLPEPGFPDRTGASRAGHWRVLLLANVAGLLLIGAALLIRYRRSRRSSGGDALGG